ncbi:hypothetical protein GCM10007358_12180 [Phocicoccus schoeneichii]|uniref:Telomeric repeat-binding factor 2 n=1 Tax=Phocicoccus schoeneichii TaxID=1812261 RepID=A0A6V7RB64_9BACL|nr:hypothetical protein [Jeotgalicoccus schoeneichii]GGH53134.1 hypothetical protein GCM10007358_12180 [Jeotgalicoccus schoeneichii]CAD2074002.1 Telomeric repeat-binding factor 2 [Jeotgalicoccus schoeneichii]
MKKLLSVLFVMGLSFLLVACGDSSDEKETDTSNEKTETEEVNKEESSEADDKTDEKVVEVGETVDVESFEWDVPYQVTVNSVDLVSEYNGEDITEYVSNADENIKFLVANTIIKNTSDEPMITGEYVIPRLGIDTEGSGENFIFELSEEELSKEIAPGEEVDLDFVFIQDLLTVRDPEGNVYLHFEGMTDDQKTYRIPTK